MPSREVLLLQAKTPAGTPSSSTLHSVKDGVRLSLDETQPDLLCAALAGGQPQQEMQSVAGRTCLAAD